MTSATQNAYTATEDDLRAACDMVCELNRQIGEKYEEIGALTCRRTLPLQAIFVAIGRAMIERGQKTQRVGDYIIEAGMNRVILCVCHGSYLSDCTTVGDVQTIERPTGEPYVKVRPLSAVKKAEGVRCERVEEVEA